VVARAPVRRRGGRGADDAIRSAQRELWDELPPDREPGGAAALAAIRTGAYVPGPAGERVVVVVCGSNCDPATVM
jgi:threonine dehydratase